MQYNLTVKSRRQRTHKERGSKGRQSTRKVQWKNTRHRTGRKKSRNAAHRGRRGSKAGKKPTHERRMITPETKQSGSGSKEATEECAQTCNRTSSRPGGERAEEGAGRRQKANKESEGKEMEGYRKRNLNRSQKPLKKDRGGRDKRRRKGELKVTTGQRSTARNTEQLEVKAEPRPLAGEGEQGRTMTPTQPKTKTTHLRNTQKVIWKEKKGPDAVANQDNRE